MDNYGMKEGDASAKPSSSSGPGVRKFTLSCARCRASKLKCDRKEPCIECVKRDIGDSCYKEERQPRAKRAKTDHKSGIVSKTNALQAQDAEAEEAAQALERFVDGPTEAQDFPSTISQSAVSFVAPDYPNVYWSNTSDPHKQVENLALVREIVDAMPGLDIIHLLHEVFVTRCQGPLGNVVHTPSFMKQADEICSCLSLALPELRAVALADTISLDILACHLLAAIVMLLLDGQEGSLALDAILVTAISGAQKLGLHQLGDARLQVSGLPSSSSEIGSVKLMGPSHVRTEVGIRVWWALVMRDWSRGQALGYYSMHPSKFNTRMPLHINDEDLDPTTLTVDNHGCITERPRSEFTMLSYTVHAIEVAGLARECVDLRGSLRQAPQQVVVDQGAKIRNHLNKKYESFLVGLPSYFRLGSPVGFTSTGPLQAIPVHRWMLHQQLWALCLRLHRANLSTQNGRISCQLLAQNVISTQTHIQARCTVCGSLTSSDTQLFNAGVVLLLDLLSSPTRSDDENSSAELSRVVTRDKIREAIELLQTRSHAEVPALPQEPRSGSINAPVQRSVAALEALMKLEEELSAANKESLVENHPHSPLDRRSAGFNPNARESLKDKVTDVVTALQRNALTTAAETEHTSLNPLSAAEICLPLPSATDEFQDLDVLPVLSNDPSCNFWQFLDFTSPGPQTESGSFSPVVGWHHLADSIAFGTLSGPAPPLINFETLEFADALSNTEDILGSQTPPSSL
ncbi:MAG: hypothetical protein Q9165_000707 [Trypethelium subeluteriae]